MLQYLLAIKYYVGNKKNVRRFRYFNCSYEELVTNYIEPYNNNVSLLISGRKVVVFPNRTIPSLLKSFNN